MFSKAILSFKRSLSHLILVLSCLVFAGCAQENQEPSDVVVLNPGEKGTVDGKDLQCLSQITQTVEQFLQGGLTDRDVNVFWNCMVYTLEVFQRRFLDAAVIDSDDLFNFLENRFLGGGKVSPVMREQAMIFKTLFLGGRNDVVVEAEIQRLANVFDDDIRDVTADLRPNIKWVIPGGNSTPDRRLTEEEESQVEAAITSMRSGFWRLADIIEDQKPTYEFSNIEILADELKRIFSSENSNTIVNSIDKLVPILKQAKRLLIGGSKEHITTGEWHDFLLTTARFYEAWLRYEHFISKDPVWSKRFIVQLGKVKDILFGILGDGLKKQPQGVLAHSSFGNLLDPVLDFTGVPFGMKNEEVLDLWKVIVDRWFKVDFQDSKEGLTREKLDFLNEFYEEWNGVQEVIHETAGPSFDVTNDKLGPLKRYFKRLPWPVVLDSSNRLMIGSTQPVYDNNSLSLLNVERVLVTLFVRAYSTDRQRRIGLTGLNKEELLAAFNDAAPLLYGIGLAEPGTMEKRVDDIIRDGNLFVPHANGDQFVEFEELMDYIHYVLSGVSSANVVNKSVTSECVSEEIRGEIFYKQDCYIESFLSHIEDNLSHLPKQKSFLQNLSREQQHEWIQNLLQTTNPFFERNFVQTGATTQVMVLSQYIETFIGLVDISGDGSIDSGESIEFVKDNFGAISSLFGGDPDDTSELPIVSAYLTYILKYGVSVTAADDPLAEIRFSYWQRSRKTWSFDADRLQLSIVLRELVQ